MDDAQYKPRMIRGGSVLPSGINPRLRTARPTVSRAPFRAVVVATRTIDEPGNLRGVSVECDVILVHTQVAVRAVPVLQRTHGVNNAMLWIPRPTTRQIGGTGQPLNVTRVLSRRGAFVGEPTPLGELDGDMVLVDYIEGNPDLPIIIGALPHEQTNRLVNGETGWREGQGAETRGVPNRDEFYLHHQGAEVRVSETGDVLIDTVGAYEDGSTEDAGADSGQVRVRVKDTQRLTIAMGEDEDVLEVWKDGGQLRVDLGEGASERLVLGDIFKSYIDAQFTRINTFWTSIFNLHTHSGGTLPGGLTGVSGTLQTDSLDALPDDALSDLARTKKT
jgi:hypothetical protein